MQKALFLKRMLKFRIFAVVPALKKCSVGYSWVVFRSYTETVNNYTHVAITDFIFSKFKHYQWGLWMVPQDFALS